MSLFPDVSINGLVLLVYLNNLTVLCLLNNRYTTYLFIRLLLVANWADRVIRLQPFLRIIDHLLSFGYVVSLVNNVHFRGIGELLIVH